MPGRVTYYAVDTATGTVLDELPLSSFKFAETLSEPDGFTAEIPVRSPKATRSILEPWATSIYAAFDDRLIFGGLLVTPKAALEKGTVSIAGKGLLSYYFGGRRTIHSRAGMAYAGGDLASDVRWVVGTDLFRVVGDLFRHAATFSGDLGLPLSLRGPGLGGILGQGLLDELKFATHERRGIGELFTELASGEIGFDFGLSYAWDSSSGNGSPVATLELDPVRGRRTSIVFEAGKNITVLDHERNGERQANAIDGFGAGEGDGMVRTPAIEAGLVYPNGRYPRLEATYTNKRTKSLILLYSEVRGELSRRKIAPEVASVELTDTSEVPLGSFVAGDLVTLVASDGYLDLSGWWRITSYDVAFGDDGTPKVTVELTPESTYGTLFAA